MHLRNYEKEESTIIPKWIRSAEELHKWSADRFNKFPLEENDIDNNYVPQIKTGRFIPLTAVDEDDKVIGHFIIRYPSEDNDDIVRFGFVIIDPVFRGKGYGKEMLLLGIKYVKENLTAKKIELGVFANNENAMNCYKNVGFKEYNRRKCEMPIGTWECIDMELFTD